MTAWVLEIPSNLTNFLHFVLLDIIVISLIFTLSSDIVGRSNDRKLRAGESHRLFISCPPLIGGGLSGTDRGLSLLMLFIRALSLSLILVCNMCIKGGTVVRYEDRVENVFVPGSLRHFEPLEFEEALLQRAGCQRSYSQRKTVYGELRQNAYGTVKCITDSDLLQRPVILDTVVRTFNVTTTNCTATKRRAWRQSMVDEIADFRCNNANIACILHPEMPDVVIPELCTGMVRHEAKTFVCDIVLPNVTTTAEECLHLENVDWRLDHWKDGYFLKTTYQSPLDMIGVMLVAGTEQRNVKIRRKIQVTRVERLWAAFASIPIAFCVLLSVWAFALGVAACSPMIHDEVELTMLLRNTLKMHNLFVLYPSKQNAASTFHSSIGQPVSHFDDSYY